MRLVTGAEPSTPSLTIPRLLAKANRSLSVDPTWFSLVEVQFNSWLTASVTVTSFSRSWSVTVAPVILAKSPWVTFGFALTSWLRTVIVADSGLVWWGRVDSTVEALTTAGLTAGSSCRSGVGEVGRVVGWVETSASSAFAGCTFSLLSPCVELTVSVTSELVAGGVTVSSVVVLLTWSAYTCWASTAGLISKPATSRETRVVFFIKWSPFTIFKVSPSGAWLYYVIFSLHFFHVCDFFSRKGLLPAQKFVASNYFW